MKHGVRGLPLMRHTFDRTGPLMMRMVTLCVMTLLLSGCSADVGDRAPMPESQSPASAEASIGAPLPPDVPGLDRLDTRQRTPGQAVIELIDARVRADWESAYSLYATPDVDYGTAVQEWIAADESYEDFRVLEFRVTAPDAAFVRVAYKAVTTPLDSSSYPVVVEEPGEWWPVHKVDGLWKTQWRPRQ